MASVYKTLDIEQLVQIGLVEEHKEDAMAMRWTDECVKLLIALYQVHEPKIADINFKNKSVWETIEWLGARGT